MRYSNYANTVHHPRQCYRQKLSIVIPTLALNHASQSLLVQVCFSNPAENFSIMRLELSMLGRNKFILLDMYYIYSDSSFPDALPYEVRAYEKS